MSPFHFVGLLFAAAEFHPVRQGATVRWERRSVDLFVPASRRCAVHFSTTSRSRAEEDESQHQYQHHRFPNKENTQRFPPITARNTTDIEKDSHQKVRVSGEAGSRIKLKELMLSTLFPFLFYERWMALYLGPFAFPCGASCPIVALVVYWEQSGPHCSGAAGLRCADGAVL